MAASDESDTRVSATGAANSGVLNPDSATQDTEGSGVLTVLVSNFPDEQAAIAACSVLLEEKLIACANIQAPCRSLYRWDGVIQDETEVPVWVKTSRAQAARARARLGQLHPYDVPEILELPAAANQAYADWVIVESAG